MYQLPTYINLPTDAAVAEHGVVRPAVSETSPNVTIIIAIDQGQWASRLLMRMILLAR